MKKYWCFHCGRTASSAAEIVHADNCRRQENIYCNTVETPIHQLDWCGKCGEHWPESDNRENCEFCQYPLKRVYA